MSGRDSEIAPTGVPVGGNHSRYHEGIPISDVGRDSEIAPTGARLLVGGNSDSRFTKAPISDVGSRFALLPVYAFR